MLCALALREDEGVVNCWWPAFKIESLGCRERRQGVVTKLVTVVVGKLCSVEDVRMRMRQRQRQRQGGAIGFVSRLKRSKRRYWTSPRPTWAGREMDSGGPRNGQNMDPDEAYGGAVIAV